MDIFMTSLDTAVNDKGELYAELLKINDVTPIKGMGSPGACVDYSTNTLVGSPKADEGSSEEEESGGLSTGVIIVVILCVVCIPVALVQQEEAGRRARRAAGRVQRPPG